MNLICGFYLEVSVKACYRMPIASSLGHIYKGSAALLQELGVFIGKNEVVN